MTDAEIKTGSLDRNFTALMGQCISDFSYLDSKVDFAIWQLLKADELIGRAVTSHIINFDTRLNILTKLFELLTPETLWPNVEAILKRIENVKRDRNTLAHGIWWQVTQPEYIAQVERYSFGKVEPPTPADWTVGRLHLLQSELALIPMDLMPILRAVLDAGQKPSPRKPAPQTLRSSRNGDRKNEPRRRRRRSSRE